MRINSKGIFLIPFLLWGVPAFAQEDSTINKALDSTLIEVQREGSKMILASDSAMRADSAELLKLEEQIGSLRGRELRKKESLSKRLDSLNMAIQARNERVKRQVDSLRENTIGVPVVFHRDTLWNIYSKLGPFVPSARAEALIAKLNIVQRDFDPERFKIIDGEETSDLFYDEMILFSITDRDAFWVDKKRQEVIIDYREILIDRIDAYLKENSLLNTLMRIGAILLVVLLLILMVRYLNKGFNRFVALTHRRLKNHIRGVKIRNYQLLTIEQQIRGLSFVLNGFKWLFILFIVYAALPLIFSVFPATEGVAKKLIGYVLDPLLGIFYALVGYIPELITILVIAIVTRYFVKLLRFLAREIENEKLIIPGFYPDWAKPTFNLVSFIVHAFAFVVIFPYLPGSDSAVFQGVSVFLGLLISLGSSSAIGNIIAGLVITYMRPFKIGDRVRIGESIGDVIEKTMLVTRIRTIKNEEVTIPNSAILNGQTINFSTSAKELGLILNTSITIGYDVHWKKVRDCLIQAAKNTEGVLKEPEPFVLQTSLDDFYVSYQINAYTREPGKAAKIYSELHGQILDVFHKAGIEIMSPHFRAERDGSTLQAPKENN